MSSIGEELPKEMARVRELLPLYDAVPTGIFAATMMRDGIDPKTAAELGGWDSVTLFIETYTHAMRNRRLTETVFGSNLTQKNKKNSKIKSLNK